jgi:4-amino-4-deoxy-L-arabinose transferase-like glycosyltransferase
LGKYNKLGNILKEYYPQISFILLLIIVTLIAFYRVKLQINLGPGWDTYDFLADALYLSGHGIGYMDLTRPPLLPFLVSLVFRMGYVSETVILILDGLFYILAVMGLYMFFRLNFDSIKSFFGALLFATFPVVTYWLGTGYTDILSVSLSIWALYFTVLAVKKNSKFFYLSFPLVMLAFLARYPAAFIVFPMVLYILMDDGWTLKLKDIFVGILLSILILIPVAGFFYMKFGDPSYPFVGFFGASSNSAGSVTTHFAYNSNFLYYINNLPDYVGLIVTILFIVVLGFVLIKFILKSRDFIELCKEAFQSRITQLEILFLLILMLVFIGTFGKVHYMITEIMSFVCIYLFYSLFKGFKIKNMDMLLFFLSWFMAFFIFHSVYDIKVGRYFITMAPALAYFLLVGLSEITNQINFKIKNKNLLFPIIATFLMVIMLFSTASFLLSLAPEDKENESVIAASNFLMNYDPSYKTKTIYSDYYWPYFSWYLKMNVTAMPIFTEGGKCYSEIDGYKVTPQDNIEFNRELYANNADYYFSIRKGLNLTGYTPIKQFNNITLYEKVN